MGKNIQLCNEKFNPINHERFRLISGTKTLFVIW